SGGRLSRDHRKIPQPRRSERRALPAFDQYLQFGSECRYCGGRRIFEDQSYERTSGPGKVVKSGSTLQTTEVRGSCAVLRGTSRVAIKPEIAGGSGLQTGLVRG